MFAKQLVSGECACGCSEGCAVQYKQWGFVIDPAEGHPIDGCNAIDNAVAWANAQTGDWNTAYSGTFDSLADTSPSSESSSSLSGGFDVDPSIIGGWGIVPGSGATITKISVLCCLATMVCVGRWCDGANDDAQESCIFSGVASGAQYDYELPLPAYEACDPYGTGCGPGGQFQMAYELMSPDVWAGFVIDCGGDTNCHAQITGTLPACMTGDPFFGDEP